MTTVIGDEYISCNKVLNGLKFIFMNYAKFMIWYKQIFGPVAIALFRIVIDDDCINSFFVRILQFWIWVWVVDGNVAVNITIKLVTWTVCVNTMDRLPTIKKGHTN